jgi:hypothetical protein
MVEDFRFADRKFIAFPAHIFDQDRQMQFAAARHFIAVRTVCFFHS